MGHILAELTKLGLSNIGYELITDIVTFKKNGPRKTAEPATTTAAEEIAEYIKEHPTFKIGDIVAFFKTMGRARGAAYEGVKALVKKKILVRLSPHNYQRADVKALAPPAPKAIGKKRRGQVAPYGISNKDLILKRIKGRAKFTTKELRDHFTNMRRNPVSISPIVDNLLKAKVITRIESGTYAWGKVKKKNVAKKTPVAVRKKRDDVAEASSLEGTANG